MSYQVWAACHCVGVRTGPSPGVGLTGVTPLMILYFVSLQIVENNSKNQKIIVPRIAYLQDLYSIGLVGLSQYTYNIQRSIIYSFIQIVRHEKPIRTNSLYIINMEIQNEAIPHSPLSHCFFTNLLIAGNLSPEKLSLFWLWPCKYKIPLLIL